MSKHWKGLKEASFELFTRRHSPLTHHSRGEWLSRLYCLRQVTENKLGRVRSDFGWVSSEIEIENKQNKQATNIVLKPVLVKNSEYSNSDNSRSLHYWPKFLVSYKEIRVSVFCNI